MRAHASRQRERARAPDARGGAGNLVVLLTHHAGGRGRVYTVQHALFHAMRLAPALLVLDVLVAAEATVPAPPTKPHILFIVSDDLRPTLGTYGA